MIAAMSGCARISADIDCHAHGARNSDARIGRFLRHVAASLEAVAGEKAGHRGSKEKRPVGARRAEVECLRHHVKRLMTVEQQQISADDDRSDDLTNKPEHRDACQDLRACEVDHR
jgi:hypothetical protein